MNTFTLRFPSSLPKGVEQLTEREGVSTNQIIATVMPEKLSALMTEDALAERAARGSRERFEAVLNKVPSVEPDGRDRLD